MDTTQTQWVIKLFIFGLLNVEKSLVYTNPHSTLRDYVGVCILSYGYVTISVGSRQPWSTDVLLRRKAAVN